MDIKEQIKKAVSKISSDKNLMEQFQKNPIKAVESVLGVDLPDNIMEKVVSGVKAGLTMDQVSGALGSLKKLF